MIKTGSTILSALQRTFSFAWQEIGPKLNLEISMTKKKSLPSKWVYIVFWYLKSAGREEVSSPDWKFYCQQNNSIVEHRLLICLNRLNNSCYIHSNYLQLNWLCSRSGQCSKDSKTNLITLPQIILHFPSRVYSNNPCSKDWLCNTIFEPLFYICSLKKAKMTPWRLHQRALSSRTFFLSIFAVVSRGQVALDWQPQTTSATVVDYRQINIWLKGTISRKRKRTMTYSTVCLLEPPP